MHDIGVQSLDDKENKGVVQNWLKSFTKGSLVYLVHFFCTISIIPLYSGTNFISLLSYMSIEVCLTMFPMV